MLNLVALTCTSLSAVDGDTIRCDGQNMRIMGPGAPMGGERQVQIDQVMELLDEIEELTRPN